MLSCKKRMMVIPVFVIVLSLFILSVSATSDVGYIYLKSFKIDNNIVNTLKEMNLSVDLILASNTSVNLSKYKFLFIGDEVFDDHFVQVSNYNAVIVNFYHGYDWGLTDNDGISQLASNAPLDININNSLFQVYTRAVDNKGIALQYYYLDNLNKAPGLIQAAGTAVGDKGVNLGDVISFASPGTQLFGNKRTSGNLCFFGLVRSSYWTPFAKQLFKDCVGFVNKEPILCHSDSDCGTNTILPELFCTENNVSQNELIFTCNSPGTPQSTCSNSTTIITNQTCAVNQQCSNGQCRNINCNNASDCNDNNPLTFDQCVNPGTISSHCLNTEINCASDLDCGGSGFIGSEFCSVSNLSRVFKNFQNATCNNPGTIFSSCSIDVNPETIHECNSNQLCSNGTCLTRNIQCNQDSDCGTSGLIGAPFCSITNASVVQGNITFICNNPGTISSSCSNSTSQAIIEECNLGCSNNSCIQGIHDVSLVDFSGSINKIKIENSSGSLFNGSELQCNQIYRIKIDLLNSGDFIENVTLNGSIGDIKFKYNNAYNLDPNDNSIKYEPVNISLPSGPYNITVNASIPIDNDLSNNIAVRQINVSCPQPPQINCSFDYQCGNNTLIPGLFCTGNNVSQQLQTFACNNAGTPDSFCSSNIINVTNSSCPDFCDNGQCKLFTCHSDLDCGTSGLIGAPFCSITNVSVVQSNITFTCNNASSINSFCTNFTTEVVNQFCLQNQLCSNAQCQNITCNNDDDCDDHNSSTLDICNNPGELNSTCSHSSIACNQNSDCGSTINSDPFCLGNNINRNVTSFICNLNGTALSFCTNSTSSQIVQECTNNQICNNAQCENVLCSSNSDCGQDALIPGLFCSNNSVAQNKLIFVCHNSGTPQSTCSNSTIIITNQVCLQNQICANAQCINQHINCFNFSDCNDNNPLTFDQCVNPGTISSHCLNTEINCASDLDCGASGFIGSEFCSVSNLSRVFKNFQNATCNNPGTLLSSCNINVNPLPIQFCSNNQLCNNGACVTQNIQCNQDSDCGTSGPIGNNFCSNNNVSRNFISFTCNNPGTISSSCSNSTSRQTVQECTSNQICSNGQCSNVQVNCNSDLDCGTSGFIGQEYCSQNDVFKNFQNFTCNNPGSAQSSCSQIVIQTQVDQCQYSCVNATCIRCSLDSQCDDNNPLTTDACINPGTVSSHCSNSIIPVNNISCNSNNDCGTSTATGDPFCSSDKVLQNFSNPVCLNPGRSNSFCSISNSQKIMSQCQYSCSNGQCILENTTFVQVDRSLSEGNYNYLCPQGYAATGVRYHDRGGFGDNFVYGIYCSKLLNLNNNVNLSMDIGSSQGGYIHTCPANEVVTGLTFHDKGDALADNYVTSIFCSNSSIRLGSDIFIKLATKPLESLYDYQCPAGTIISGVNFNSKGSSTLDDNFVSGLYCSSVTQ